MFNFKAFTVFLTVFSFVFLQFIDVYAETAEGNYTEFPDYYASSYKPQGMTEFGRAGLEAKQRVNSLRNQYLQEFEQNQNTLVQKISVTAGQKYEDKTGQNPYYMQAQAGFSIPAIGVWIMQRVQGVISFVTQFFSSISNFLTGIFNFAIDFFTDMFDLTLMKESSREDALQAEEALVEEIDEVRDAAQEDVVMQTEHLRDIDRELARSVIRTKAFIEDGTAEEMCVLSTGYSGLSGGFGASLSGAARMSIGSASRGSGNTEDGAPESPLDDITDRYRLAVLFCNPADMGGAVNPSGSFDTEGKTVKNFSVGGVDMTVVGGSYEVFCPFQCPGGEGDKCKPANAVLNAISEAGGRLEKHPGIYNLDTNYTLAIDLRRTWGAGQYWVLDDNKVPTILEGERYERDLVADTTIAEYFMTHIFREAIPAVPEEVFDNAYNEETQSLDVNVAQFLLDHRSLQAYRSVAKNSFITIINRKNPFQMATSVDDNPTLLEQASEMFLGVERGEGVTGDKFTDFYKNIFEEMMGEGQDAPSYEGQLEFLAKMLYMHPDFLADTANEENFENKLLVTSATKSIVTHDLLQSMMRQEAILATLLEVLLEGKHQSVRSQASAIGAGSN